MGPTAVIDDTEPEVRFTFGNGTLLRFSRLQRRADAEHSESRLLHYRADLSLFLIDQEEDRHVGYF